MMPLAILHRLRCLIKSQAVCIAILFLIMPLMSSSSVYAEADLKTSRVLFVTSKKTAIYTQVVDLVKGNLRNQQANSYQFTVVLGKSFADAQINFSPDLIVTVGASASELVMKEKPVQPVLAVLITDSAFEILANKYYGSKAGAHAAQVSVICLDQPIERSIKLAKLLVPEAKIAGIMTGPSSQKNSAEFAEHVVAAAMTPKLVNIELTDNPIHKLEPIIRDSDVFIPVPDNRLINIATARWILQLSFRYQIPVIAYSKTYLDAGATAAIFSSVENVAKQTSEFITDEKMRIEAGAHMPAYYSIKFNYSVAGNLNIDLKTEQFYRNKLQADSE